MTPPYPWLVAAPVVGLAIFTLSHLILVRLRHWPSPYPPLMLAFLPGLVAMAAVSAWALSSMHASWTDIVGFAALNALTYAALGWGYFHFVNMGIASLRIRMLRELEDAGGSLSRARLLTEYNSESVVALRIHRLTSGGHFIVVDDRYHIGRKRFLVTARLFDLLRRILFGSNYRALSAARSTTVSPLAERHE